MIKNWADVITQRGNVGTIMLFMFTFSLSTYAQDLMWEQTSMPYRGQINAILATPDGNIYAGTHGGIFRSEDGGDTWLNLGLRETLISSFVALGATLYVGIRVATGEGVLRSDDRGKNWISTGLTDFGISSLAVMDQTLFAGTYNVGVFRSKDGGDTWTTANQGLTNFVIGALAVMGTTLYAGTGEGDGGGVFRSDDRGNTWVKTGLADVNIISLAVMNTTLFASSYQGEFFLGVFRSEDGGKTWTEANIGLSSLRITSFVVAGATIFAGGGGVFCSENGGHSWVTMRLAKGVGSLAISGETLYAGTFNDGLFRTDAKCGPRSIPEDMSKDNTWLESGLVNRNVSAFAVLSRALFAGTYGAGIFRSEDKGNTWVKAGLENQFVTSLSVMGTTLFAGTYYKGVFRSDDQGRSWIEVNNGIPPWKWDIEVNALAVMGDTIFASINWMGVYRSEDRGNSWVRVSGAYKSLSVFGKTLYATSDLGGVFRSEDGGNSWTALGLGDKGIRALTVMGTTLYAASPAISFGRGMYCFDAESQKWREVNKGLTNKTVYSLAVIDRTLFAGTGGGVFRASLSETAVAVNRKGKLSTSWGKIKTALLQNYPNPFNPETWIPFSLAETSEVRIRIYDIKGNLVKTLNLGYRDKGFYLSKDHAAYWDGRNNSEEYVSSGVYFYELMAGNFRGARKMVVLR